RIRGMDDVADVNQPYSGTTVDRSGNRAIVEQSPRIVDRTLIEPYLRFELRYHRPLSVGLLASHRVGFGKIDVTLEIELGIGERGLIERLLGDDLIKLRLVGNRIDLRQHVAALDFITFPEIDANQLTIDLAAYSHHVERTRRSDPLEINRHVGNPRF